MKIQIRIATAALGIALVTGTSPAARAVSSAPQVRQLVYSFTWGTTNATETHISGIAMTGNSMGMNGGSSGSGMVSSTGGASDHGTITVDVERQQPDKGVVVSISEQAVERRSAPAATCVVYGDLTVVCDPNKKINVEELALLRLLGSNFVDPSDLDAQRHWQRHQDAATSSYTSDFTISKNANGMMTINETAIQKDTGARPGTSNVTGTIVYDFNRTIPTSLTEQTVLRSEQGEEYQTVTSETALQLVSDSSAVPH